MRALIAAIVLAGFALAGCASIKRAYVWTYDTIAGKPANPPAESCDCDLSGPITEPTRGAETPLPGGLDIRFRAWSPAKRDVVFIGANQGSFSVSDNQITGHCFDHPDGGRYHYIGHRVPSSTSPLNPARTGTYARTYRMDYERRGEK